LAGFADNLTSQSATIIPILINAAGGIVLDRGWSTYQICGKCQERVCAYLWIAPFGRPAGNHDG